MHFNLENKYQNFSKYQIQDQIKKDHTINFKCYFHYFIIVKFQRHYYYLVITIFIVIIIKFTISIIKLIIKVK